MSINIRNLKFSLDWKAVSGIAFSICGTLLLNDLINKNQLKSLNIDLKNKKLQLN